MTSTEWTGASVNELASMLQELRDKDAIAEHTATYNEAWDDGRSADWVATWTPDAVFELPGAPDTVGSEALYRMVEAMQSVGFVHITTNHRIAVDGDTAQQRCYAILATRSPSRKPGSSQWLATGRYQDTLVRTAGGWRFARRVFTPDASLGTLPKWW